MAQELIAYGADTVYVADHPALKNFNDDSYAAVLTSLAKQHKPETSLRVRQAIADPSFQGSVFACTGLTADCTVLDIDNGDRPPPPDTSGIWREHHGHDRHSQPPSANGNRET